MKLKEHIEKFDKSLNDSKEETSKSQLKEHIEKFDESLGEPEEQSAQPFSYRVDEKLSIVEPVEQLRRDISDKDRVIENLKNESVKLKNKISDGEKEKFTILEELKKSGWLENKVTLSSKYKGKLKTILGEIKVVDTKIISMLTAVGRKKQSNQKLNWDGWLKIPENSYLYAINEDIAKGVFRATSTLIESKNEEVLGGGEDQESESTVFSTNYSLTFDRSNEEYVSTTFDPDDYNLKDGFTVSFWVRPDELGSTRFAMGSEPATNKRFNFGLHNNTKIHVAVGSNRQRSALHGMSTGNWFHYAVAYAGGSGGSRLIYINGTVINDLAGTANWGASGGGENLWFGAKNKDGWTSGWSCGLTDVAIFDEMKDSDWISATYNSGVPTNLLGQSGLVGYWRFEEGSGTTVSDSSGNNNDGTFGAISGDTTALPTWSADTPQ